MISFKGRHHQQDIILQCVRWYVAYSLSYRNLEEFNIDENKRIKIRQCKYLNNIVEQDHRFIKRRTRPMLGFKSFWSAHATLAGIELWRVLKKGQSRSSAPAWEQFYTLAVTG